MEINEIIEKQREFFETGATKNIKFRQQQLSLLIKVIKDNEKLISEALNKDLNKSVFEAYATEIGLVLQETGYLLKNLKKFSRPEKVRTPLVHFPSSSRIYKDPYGTALIMSPWNYPFLLTLSPVAAALAAGNTVIVKPSAYAQNTSSVIKKILSENFNSNYISVVEGGREINKSLLEHKFDYIFFTGSVAVGKTVMRAASENLTPVTLELGGKSPCIVDKTANIDLSAKRIVWGKFINAGQTCVAPDYILVQKSVKERLIEALKKYIVKFYGAKPLENANLPKIINVKHFERLLGLMKNQEIAAGGTADSEKNKIEPTILNNVPLKSPVMQEEIFGPILPVIEYDTLNDVVKLVNARPKPLALYFFTSDKETEKFILKNISFGGGCINDTIVHLATSYMPFGGVGDSGMGSYHGKSGFDTFSHRKSILKKSRHIDIPIRYPSEKDRTGLLKLFMK